MTINMKKYLIILVAAISLFSCTKDEEFRTRKFPGYTGSGTEATWVVFSHTVSDVAYLTGVLPTLTPPSTYAAFDAALISARQREVTPFSIRLFKSGEVAFIGKNAQNQNAWVKQTNLKWEELGETMLINKNLNGTWVNIMIGYVDQSNLLLRFKKAYFGDATAEKDKTVADVLYTIFQ
jgi:hypothetical protein